MAKQRFFNLSLSSAPLVPGGLEEWRAASVERFQYSRSHHFALSGGGFVNGKKLYKSRAARIAFTKEIGFEALFCYIA